MWSLFSRNRRGFRTWDQFHRIEGTCKGCQSYRVCFCRWFSDWKLMSNYVVNIFLKHARFQDLGPIPFNRGDLQGWRITHAFLSIVGFPAGNLGLIMWSTFSRNRRGFRTWDQIHRIERTCNGGQSYRVCFCRWFSGWKFMSNFGVNVFQKQARFQHLGPVPPKAGDL